MDSNDVASVNVFAEGPDVELRKQIDKAKKLFKGNGLLSDVNVKATVEAAYQKAHFKRINHFLKIEFKEGLRRANYSEENADKFAREIVDISHKVRHEAQVSGDFNTFMFVAEGKLQVLEQEEMEILKKNGSIKVADGPITSLFPIVRTAFQRFIEPAMLGSANAITKRVEGLQKNCSVM